MSGDYDEKVLASTRTFLSRWQRSTLRVLPHGPSLPHLVIVLSREGASAAQNLTLAVDPIWWRGSFVWEDAQLSIDLVETASTPAAEQPARDRLFRITDSSRDFECLTEWLEVKENVRL
jgi:hypothetical protein